MKKNLIAALIISSFILVGCGDNTTNNTVDNSASENKSEIVVVDTITSSADEALQMLKDGNIRFSSDTSILRNISSERRNELKDGQNPYAVIVSCSDSRVTPTTIFNAGLGEIFDVRLAGNVVDDEALGSIKYAVEHLSTPLVVVMGHESCGAVIATYNEVIKGEKVTGNMESFVEKITPSINKEGTVDDAIHTNIDRVVQEISEDEAIKTLIQQGKIKVVGAYYNLDGVVNFNE
ncbi:carbonic anhydrase [Clostridium saudiense]|uniref:carbonic anhydrase n=1 Tax=Clostridium saudiense TaxID=1414720 RepID=UPI00266F4D50|nr:carbonic anhydrase [Clostridium saudiense]